MTVPAFHFEAKKHAYRQTQDGIVVSFVVHPNDVSAALAVAALGTRYMVALAAIGDDGEPLSPGAPIPGSARNNPAADDQSTPHPSLQRSASGEAKPQRTLSQFVGMRCNDKGFQAWIAEQEGMEAEHVDEPFAATWVRNKCDVHSRTEIKTGSLAEIAWKRIEARFLLETGRIAEER